METSNKTIKTVKKAAFIIEVLSHYGSAGVREMARLTNNDKSTVSRILMTLEGVGFVSRSAVNGKYFLSPKLFEIANRSLTSWDIRARLEPHLQKLNKITGETILTGVVLHGDILYIHKLKALQKKESQDDREITSEIGYRVPIYNTAGGKAVLAFLPPAERDQLLNSIAPFKKTAKKTVQSKTALLEELEEVKKRGYAISDGEYKDEFIGVAAPLFNFQQKVFGAVAIVVPSSRMNKERIEEFGKLVALYGNKMSFDLGYQK
jgi:IclR family KDG regulon transcriptional repressor